jgi:hypothetical protein
LKGNLKPPDLAGNRIEGVLKSPRLLRCRLNNAVALVLVLVAILPGVLVWCTFGPPSPQINDEFAHLLLADTFNHARLTNPPIAQPAFFNAIFTLTYPSYTAKYQPGPGLLLALGRVLFGHPFAGVLMSVAALSLSIWWAARAVLPATYAALAGSFSSIQFGLFHYWGASYWGGALAGTGGALVVGAWLRCLQSCTPGSSAALALGCGVLLLTRPFEGALLCAATLAHLGFRAARGRLHVARKAAISFSAIILATVCFQVSYDLSTTGSPLVPPYVRYTQLYQCAPYFWLQRPSVKNYPNEQLKSLHTVTEMQAYSRITESGVLARWLYLGLRPITRIRELLPLWSLPIFLALPFAWRDRAVRLLFWLVFVHFALLMLETYLYPPLPGSRFPSPAAVNACHSDGRGATTSVQSFRTCDLFGAAPGSAYFGGAQQKAVRLSRSPKKSASGEGANLDGRNTSRLCPL